MRTFNSNAVISELNLKFDLNSKYRCIEWHVIRHPIKFQHHKLLTPITSNRI